MARLHSQNKGKNFERQLCEILSQHFGEGFKRTPYSGSIFGKTNISRSVGMSEGVINTLTGDLMTPDGFPFSVECKAYQDLEFHRLLTGNCTKVDSWTTQATQDATLSKKEMLVVFKLNNKGIFVCLNYDLIKDFNLDNYIKYKNFAIISLEKFLEMKNNINIVKEFIEGRKING